MENTVRKNFNLDKRLIECAEIAAKQSKRSLTGWVEYLIENELKALELWPK